MTAYVAPGALSVLEYLLVSTCGVYNCSSCISNWISQPALLGIETHHVVYFALTEILIELLNLHIHFNEGRAIL